MARQRDDKWKERMNSLNIFSSFIFHYKICQISMNKFSLTLKACSLDNLNYLWYWDYLGYCDIQSVSLIQIELIQIVTEYQKQNFKKLFVFLSEIFI
jgi:hypothetical protein